MTHEEFLKEYRPLRLVGCLIPVALLFPAFILWRGEGHGLLPLQALAAAMEFALLAPALFILRPRVVIYSGLLIVIVLVIASVVLQGFYTGPDWADVVLPRRELAIYRGLLWGFHGTMFILGLSGWVRYFRVVASPSSKIL